VAKAASACAAESTPEYVANLVGVVDLCAENEFPNAPRTRPHERAEMQPLLRFGRDSNARGETKMYRFDCSLWMDSGNLEKALALFVSVSLVQPV